MAIRPRPDYEGTRACRPISDGYVEREGVHTFYEVYGAGESTILFMPTWSLVHSRVWRMQIAYFARHFRVITFDGRGNGRSDRPQRTDAYQPWEFALDALEVMDATGTERAITVSLSAGTAWNLILAAGQPGRVEGAVFVGPTLYAVSEPFPEWSRLPFNQRFDDYTRVRGQNRFFIGEHYPQFAEFWARLCLPEPHSTRAIEIMMGMCLDTTGEVVVATLGEVPPADTFCAADRLAEAGALLQPLAAAVSCPTLVIRGALDPIALHHWAQALATDTGGQLVTIDSAGHVPNARRPVGFNLELRRFVERVAAGDFRASVTAPSR
jgi:pimeloyl-ACP methyl ester carboxylesterase